jgi:hypothetical protein
MADPQTTGARARPGAQGSGGVTLEGVATVPTFLRIEKDGVSKLGRSMRLKDGDILVAIDGQMFSGDVDALQRFFEDGDKAAEEADIDPRWLVTFCRGGVFFHQIYTTPLRGSFDHCPPETALEIAAAFRSVTYGPIAAYQNYEVFRELKAKVAAIHPTQPDPLATTLPPLWMLNHRLYFPMVGALVAYGVTLLTHWTILVIVHVLLALYTRRAQLNLLRSYQLYRDRLYWHILAETDEVRARANYRLLDPEVRFDDEPERVKSRRRKRRKGEDEAEAGKA